MAKKEKTREELIAEANKTTPTDDGADTDEQDPPLSAEAKAVQDRILGMSEAEIAADENDDSEVDPKHEAVEAAVKKLQRIHAAYSPTAPNEHVCFGNGGERFLLGDLRALMAMLPPL